MQAIFLVFFTLVYLPLQRGKSKYPDLHSLHFSPMILDLQEHNPEPSHVSVPSPRHDVHAVRGKHVIITIQKI